MITFPASLGVRLKYTDIAHVESFQNKIPSPGDQRFSHLKRISRHKPLSRLRYVQHVLFRNT